MTDEKIRELCEAATPGPWRVDEWQELTAIRKMVTCDLEHCGNPHNTEQCGVIGVLGETDAMPDAKFIAAARELVPRLLERAQSAEALFAQSVGDAECDEALKGISTKLDGDWLKVNDELKAIQTFADLAIASGDRGGAVVILSALATIRRLGAGKKLVAERNDLQQAMQWIPVSERLPNEHEPVVVRHTSQDGGITPMYRAAFLEGGQWYELNDWDYLYHITHWYPLPIHAPPVRLPLEDGQKV